MEGVNAIPIMKHAMIEAFALSHDEAYMIAVALQAQPFDFEEGPKTTITTGEPCYVEGIGIIERVYELK